MILCVLEDEKINLGVSQFYCPVKISKHLEHAATRAFRYQKALHNKQMGEGVSAPVSNARARAGSQGGSDVI